MDNHQFYVLDGTTPVKAKSIQEWGEFMEDINKRLVAFTQMDTDECVSTVFLGVDHSFGLTNVPLFFETMIFGGQYDSYRRLYPTWEAAERGHHETVQTLLQGEIR